MTNRIAWLTPWNIQSAIAMFSAHLVAELRRRGHEVTIFRTEAGSGLELENLPYDGEVVALSDVDPHVLRWQFDHVVSNVGNHFPFHGALPRVMDEFPMLAIFHDGLIAHLADPWSRDCLDLPTCPTLLARSVYGGDFGNEEGFWLPLDDMAKQRPMTGWLAGMAAGCFTHSHFWKGELERYCPGGVTVHPLSMPDEEIPPPPPWSDRIVIATVGHVNRNKRVEEVLYALASDSLLAERCEYRLFGHCEESEKQHLTKLAQQLGVRSPTFTGWLTAEELRREMSQVHVISCLRYPVLEAGSASLITAMRSGRPTLVSNHGAYGEVAPEAVMRCTPGNESLDVLRHLSALMENPERADEIGQRAQAYVAEVNSVTSYIDALEPAMENATRAAPRIAMLREMGKVLGGLGVTTQSEDFERIVIPLAQSFNTGR
ncbi:glycosyltransferase [Fulvimarina endophytica]|uniref:Glycosyltransferase n=1 Tax=Fulvimarina endophytica TaxID=2293836 RepID=A0A371X3R4_9HYPH|nr:glycosyltransferase family 4 protein [Fulvimarina endophytica]RFC63654.1 glycosyltransferase [Fulvimarina endophytica]